jgi:hypothetical protein
MSKQNGPQTNFRKESITEVIDINGDVILEIGLHEYIVKNPDGSRIHRRINKTIQLVDGMVWHPGMMSKVPLVVCQQCRDAMFGPKIHGLVSQKMAKPCIDGCGQSCCMRHARQGRDKKWRCLRHHNSHLLKNLFRPIFFEEE